jgi:multiple antibiotic resistance protein
MDFLGILTVSITLFAVIDMFGNIPLIIKLKKEYGHINSLKGSVLSSVIMILTLFFGKTFFHVFGIETYHFALAGSFLLLNFGFRMVLSIESKDSGKKQAKSATIFPIVFPLVAGPGALSSIISLRSEFSDLTIIIGILINGVVIFSTLKLAPVIEKKIGIVGINLIERIFGIILIAIGMKMLIMNLLLSLNEFLEFMS